MLLHCNRTSGSFLALILLLWDATIATVTATDPSPIKVAAASQAWESISKCGCGHVKQPGETHQKAKPTNADHSTMTDFLSRESELLGGQFSSSGEIDFDRAASAFPDISLDGSSDIPTPTLGMGAPALSHQTSTSSYADFDDFATPPPHNDVKVTGDDEIEQFESQFPDIDVPVVSANLHRRLSTFVLMTVSSLHLLWFNNSPHSAVPQRSLLAPNLQPLPQPPSLMRSWKRMNQK